jgi:hypothetical protein
MVGFLMADEITIAEAFTVAVAGSPKYAQITDELMAEAATGDEARLLIRAAADSLRHP